MKFIRNWVKKIALKAVRPEIDSLLGEIKSLQSRSYNAVASVANVSIQAQNDAKYAKNIAELLARKRPFSYVGREQGCVILTNIRPSKNFSEWEYTIEHPHDGGLAVFLVGEEVVSAVFTRGTPINKAIGDYASFVSELMNIEISEGIEPICVLKNAQSEELTERLLSAGYIQCDVSDGAIFFKKNELPIQELTEQDHDPSN